MLIQKQLFMKTKKIFGMIAICMLSIITGCSKKNDNMTSSNQSIAVLVSSNANLSLLKAAVVRAGLVETLSGSGTFTVFAPDNDAFAAAGLGSEDKINAVPVATLKNILLYHVSGQVYDSGSITTGTTEINTAFQAKAYVTRNSNGIFVNGAVVKQADIRANNGVVHIINKVLMPPPGNLVTTAQANANLTFLVAAVVRASVGNTNVAQVLSGNGPYTVFAPTNAAFQAAGFASINAIQTADPNTLANILTYHVIAGRILSTDLTDGAMPQTLNGGKVTISISGGAKVKGNKNSTAANITAADVIATNGVVHVIDQVLLP
ncbi:MAG: beta-Ig-H3/fasciclin [Mucilaginibacter sp.]|nr:MAG: beta-Ig-H3/fasciclin [Mucilaginibacter sp.]HEK20777.1 fasciclin domain-containing protein [Bacteroidota bacterium]